MDDDLKEGAQNGPKSDLEATGDWLLRDGELKSRKHYLRYYLRVLTKWKGDDILVPDEKSYNITTKLNGELKLSDPDAPLADDDDDVLAKLTAANDNIYLIEMGKHCNACIDGVFRKQAVVPRSGLVHLQIQKHSILFNTGDPTGGNKKSRDPHPEGKTFEAMVLVEAEGKQAKFVLPVGEPAIIGSNSLCDIQLRTGPEFVAGISFIDDSPLIFPIEGEEFEVAEQKITSPTFIRESFLTMVGNNTLDVRFPDDTPFKPMEMIGKLDRFVKPDMCLLLTSCSSPEQFHKIVLPPTGSTITIGRHPDNDLLLKETEMSRHHAQLAIHASNAVLTDQDSLNGTFVNGERISSCRVKPGDVINFSNAYEFLLCYS